MEHPEPLLTEEHVYHVPAPADVQELPLPSGIGSCLPLKVMVVVNIYANAPATTKVTVIGLYRDGDGKLKDVTSHLSSPGFSKDQWPDWVRLALRASVKKARGL